MPRPRKRRMVGREPGVKYFKPHGVPLSQLDEIQITVDEYEALRLADLEGMNQDEASSSMNISQPTFYRLLKSARNKVSRALVKGKAIRIGGGDYEVKTKGRRGKRGHRHGKPPKTCVCECGTSVPHQAGIPCNQMKCPDCGKNMTR